MAMPEFLQLPALVFKYFNMALGYSGNVRNGFLMRSDELKMAKEDEIKEVFSITPEEKVVPPRTNAELYIKQLNNKIPGFGALVNILFSPNMAKVLALVGIGFMAFTPLGWPVAVAGISLNLGVLAFMTYREVQGVRAAQDNQRKYSILRETEKETDILKQKKQELAKDPLKQGLLDDTYLGDKPVANRQAAWANQAGGKYDPLSAALWGIGFRTPTMIFSLVIAIISLNPIAIGLTTTSMILGSAATARQAQRGAKVGSEFATLMADKRSALGLPNIAGHEGTVLYAVHLSEMKGVRRALDAFEKDYEKIKQALKDEDPGLVTAENMRKIFMDEYYSKEPVVDLSPKETSFAQGVMRMLGAGVTWSKAKSAQVLTNPKYDSHFNDHAYDTSRNTKVSQQLDKEREIGVTQGVKRLHIETFIKHKEDITPQTTKFEERVEAQRHHPTQIEH